MRSLLLFFIKFYAFFLFLILEILSFYLIVQHNYYQKASFINSANKVSASIYNTVHSVKEYTHLKEINQQLIQENARLLNTLEESFFNNSIDTNSVTDTANQRKYFFIGAAVINNSTNKRNNYLTINRGKLHGVEKKMGVISTNGIVGIIKDVSDHYAAAISLLHKDASISVKISNSNYIGSLVWEGDSYRMATLKDIARHIHFNIGDTVVTSGFSAIFPPNIMIGTIEGYKINEGDNFYNIQILLSTDFNNLSYVFVVKNFMYQEQLELETKTQDD